MVKEKDCEERRVRKNLSGNGTNNGTGRGTKPPSSKLDIIGTCVGGGRPVGIQRGIVPDRRVKVVWHLALLPGTEHVEPKFMRDRRKGGA